jgi:uracil-DNA glycosylase
MNSIQKYQQDCFKNYKYSIDYPESNTYLFGNPINVLVPIETAINKIMIIGAYPSAKFFTINGITDVPLVDNDSPFSNELYFDGSRVRCIPSGKELNEIILKKTGVLRKDCWITDLVKVFLFKEGHVRKYNELMNHKVISNRSLFMNYALKSISWIEREIQLCNPFVIILLGIEVVKTIFQISDSGAIGFLDGKRKTKDIQGKLRNFICLPHPGILMKSSSQNIWPKRFDEKISWEAKNEIIKLKSYANVPLKHNIKGSYGSH